MFRVAAVVALGLLVGGCMPTEPTRNRPPTVVITDGPSGVITADTARFEWSGADADGNLAGYYYGLDDSTPGEWTDAAGVTLRAVGLGRHDFYLQAADDSGARSAVTVRAFERAYAGGVPHVGTDTTLEVATWNIQNFPKDSERTVGALLGIIPQLDLDVYAIQEVEDTSAFSRLVDGLAGYSGLLSADDYGNNSYQKTAVIYKRSVVSVSGVRQLFWENESVVRPPLELDVTASVRGRVFDFRLVVMHLKAGTSYGDFAQRRATCRLLKERIDAELAAGRDSDYVVVGDWNDEVDDLPEDNAFQAFIDDSASYRFLTLPLAGNSYYSSYIGGGLIDHLLVTCAALPEYGPGSTVTLRLDDEVPDYEELVSDHRPVMASFMLP
jgi:endonuclease/exonuclease/phosphatase family metal-dependent hydrolase